MATSEWTDGIPTLAGQISTQYPQIEKNFEDLKEILDDILYGTVGTTDTASFQFASATGFHDGTYTYDFPTNGVAGNSVIMIGNSSTIAWFYLNTAPPGWKVSTTGKGTVLAVSDTTGTSSGTADTNTENKLVDSGATFSSDGVVVGDTAYNTTDGTVATVTAVDSETSLSLDSDAFPDGNEGYIVGKAYVEAGGRQASDGTFTITGLTKDAHTHSAGTYAGPSHTHSMATGAYNATSLSAYVTTTGGYARTATGSGGSYSAWTGVTASSGTDSVTGDSGAQSDSAVTSDGTWRPSASIGKLFQLDTA